MIKSMTGYGSAKMSMDELEISVEIKSVNNRYLDTSVRIPRNYIFAEDTIRSAVSKHITRGKVDVFVTIDSFGAGDIAISINELLAEEYVKALKKLSDTHGLSGEISAMGLSRYPDVLRIERRELDKTAIANGIAEVLEQALCEFDGMRIREGEKMREDVLSQIEKVSQRIEMISKQSPDSVSEYKEKLEARIRDMLEVTETIEARLLTEVALFADKVDVNEEIVRLNSHLSQLRDMIMTDSPVGRKLDFLIQEINREINTIGSKCSRAEITRHVVDIKSDMEKVREQIQNVE